MFGRKWAERKRAERAAERVLADARTAADAARKALHEARSANGGRSPNDEDVADAVQAAILGSILPFVSEASSQGKTEPDRQGGGGALALLVGVGIGVGVAAWARKDDDLDSESQADSEWELINPSSAKAIKTAINETLDQADRFVRQAVRVTAQTMGAAIGTVADAAGPTAELVTDKIKLARTRATSEVIRTLDDLDDVWGSDPDEPDTLSSSPKARKPAPRKPVVGKPTAAATQSSAAKSPARKAPTRKAPTRKAPTRKASTAKTTPRPSGDGK